ncbi:DNA integrity scanning protein DisA nucleotide-binding domain protein [Deferrisoma palaeochoriense]
MDVTRDILYYSAEMARKIGARAVVVYADVFPGLGALREFVEGEPDVSFVLVSRGASSGAVERDNVEWVRVPGIRLTRLGQVKIAVLLGFSRGLFQRGDRLICLTGIAGSGALDTIVFMEVGEEFEMFAATGAEEISSHVNPEVFERVLDIAVALGYEGREGKPVGTTFVIGDTDNVLARSTQMVLNPFRGYPEEERNILDPALEPTIKEFAAIDGAFVIRGDGLVEAAGVYLRPEQAGEPLPRGLGTRHNAAAGITAVTKAVAVTVSESTGTVTVFRDGKILMEVERPRPIGEWGPREDRLFPGLRTQKEG